MNVLITGITGFVGGYLVSHLQEKNEVTLFGTYNSDRGLSAFDQKKAVTLIKADLSVKEEVVRVIEQSQPDHIYHLAALTAPAESLKDPSKTLTANIGMEVNVLEAIKGRKDTKTLIVSSAHVYGKVKKEDLPITEDTPLRPADPYSVSKIAQEYLGVQYTISFGLPSIRVRPFNHIGPRQSTQFVVAAFAKQIAEIEVGKQEPVLHVGDLKPRRDFTDVRDMVVAYELAMEKGVSGEVYNIGSGTSHSIQEILDMLLSLSTVTITVKTKESLLRESDISELRADSSKFTAISGWKPTIPLEKTLKDTLDYFRNMVQ